MKKKRKIDFLVGSSHVTQKWFVVYRHKCNIIIHSIFCEIYRIKFIKGYNLFKKNCKIFVYK